MPDYRGDDLTADMEAVWETAATNFPAMAEAYHSANYAVYLTSEVIPGDDGSQFMAPWRQLRDQLILALGYSSRCVEDTATALREAMDAYAEQDEAARDALNSATEDLPSYVPELSQTKVPTRYASNNPYSTQSFDPVGIGYLEAMYDGTAPTMEDLLAKARTVDDKLLEASKKDHGLFGQVIDWVVPDSVIEGEAEEMGYVTIEQLLGEALRGNPGWYEYGITALRSISNFDADDKPFGRFRTEVNNAKDALHPDIWGGESAENFRRDFLNAYEDIAENQALLLGELLGALEGYQQGLEDTYRKYDEAMDAAIDAFQGLIDGAEGALASLATAVLSAVISIVGTVATGGSATAVRFALAGAGVSIASTQVSVGGSDFDAVSLSIREAIGTIKGTLEDFDEALASALESDVGEVTDARFADGVLVLPRPAFANDHTRF